MVPPPSASSPSIDMPFLQPSSYTHLPPTPTSPLVPLSPAYLARGFKRSTRHRRSVVWAVVGGLVLGSLVVAELVRQYDWRHGGSVAVREMAREGLQADRLEEGSEQGGPTHPIVGLMQEAEDRWQALYDRQSKTLDDAISEYQRRYDRPPPAGFDDWFAWTQVNDVHFVDEYDRLEPAIATFGGLSPRRLQAEVDKFEKKFAEVGPDSRLFQIKVENGTCVGRGMDKWVKELGTNRRSGWEFCEAIRDIVHLIPDTPDFVYTTNDLGEITISHDERERLKHMGKTNQRASVDWQPEPYMSPDLAPRSSETAYLAVALSCPSDSPARRFHEDLISGKIAWDESKEEYALPANLGGFIRNASKAQDPCYNTEMRQSAGLFLQWPIHNFIIKGEDHVPDNSLTPIFSQSKVSTQSDWLIPQLYSYPTMHKRLDESRMLPPWEERGDQLIWRGALTGIFYPGSHSIGGEWQEAHRTRLHRQCNDDIGFEKYVYATSPASGSKLQHGFSLKRDLLSWYDCGVVGHPDCGYDECKAVDAYFNGPFKWTPPESHYERYKFVADIDGYGWSGRFRELLLIESMVFKATAFPEWFSDHLVPWYHYVPFSLDSSDLPSLMAFYAGAPRTKAGAHDNDARKIARRGKEFVERHWKKENIQAWIWRTLLEYRRVRAENGELDLVRP